MLEVDADRDLEDALGRNAGADHELVHLVVRHLHAIDARRIALERVVRAVELGIPRRAGAAVEVAEPEAVRRIEPARL